jgi:uncharacterized membrane protein YidH (DUF202 family)
MLHVIRKTCSILLLIAAGLLASVGAMTGKPEEASQLSILSRVAYFTFLAVLLVLVSVCVKLYLYSYRKIRDDYLIVCGFPFCNPPDTIPSL